MSMRNFLNGKVTLHAGDCMDVIKTIPDASIDSVVTDPPYALVSIVKRFGGANAAPAKGDVYARASSGFMGKQWDTGETAFAVEFWAEVMRVLKPGGHVIAASATRTYHRLAVAIEDAGFEIRDQVQWIYASGFPKSHDVSKGIDKLKDWSLIERLSGEIKRARGAAGLSLKQIGEAMQAATGGQYGAWYHRGGHMFFETGRSLPSRPEWEQLRLVLPISDEFADVYEEAEREVTGTHEEWTDRTNYALTSKDGLRRDNPATDAARQWQGWGTALKPCHEPIVLARKPLEGTVAANVLKHGVGGLNIDGCRVPSSTGQRPSDGGDKWEREEPHCGLSAVDADAKTKPEAQVIEAFSATKPAEQTLSGRDETRRLGTSKTGIGCSDGMMADDTATNSSTDEYGKTSTDPSPQGSTSITSTKTEAIIASKTSNASPDTNTDSDIGSITPETKTLRQDGSKQEPIANGSGKTLNGASENAYAVSKRAADHEQPKGRFPGNLIHDGSDEVLEAFAAFGEKTSGKLQPHHKRGEQVNCYGKSNGAAPSRDFGGDTGTAARFFFSAKADASDRIGSKHPTVKPVDLMQYLVRLVTPKGGTVLDPFAGTGTTGEAAFREGMRCVLIEREAEYQVDIARRMDLVLAGPDEKRHAILKAKNKVEDAGPLFGGLEAAE